jgi:ubiquinone/menaquinone biosynthesis C-methylase UbiE
MARTLLAIAILLPSLLTAQNTPKQKASENFHKPPSDSKASIAMMENPQRDAEQKPAEVIAALGLKNGEKIADIGAGSGYFAFRFARQVGSSGRVYAVDIDPDMILHMNKRVRDLKLTNVVTVLSAPDDPLLAENSIDRFFVCNTWHYLKNPPKYMGLIKRMLKPGGQLIIVDYKMKAAPAGLPPEMKVPKREVMNQLETNGYKLIREHDFLPQQYFLVFSPQ